MKKISICSKDNNDAILVKEKLIKLLKSEGFHIVDNKPDIVISVGGDGTFIYSLRGQKYSTKPKYIGINLGTLGFLQEVEPDMLEQFVKSLKGNKLRTEKVALQATRVVTRDHKEIKYRSFNEVVVRDSKLDVLEANVLINGFKLEKFVGDGLLVSTPSGSTAHNMSLGGSVIHPSINALQITSMAPLNSKAYKTLNNSVIVPIDMKIRIYPCKEKASIMLSVDGENNIIDNVWYVETKISRKNLQLLKFADYDYWEKIESKFLN